MQLERNWRFEKRLDIFFSKELVHFLDLRTRKSFVSEKLDETLFAAPAVVRKKL